LPALVQWREADMPGEIRRKVAESVSSDRTGWFDTHPCDADRIASARREPGSGLFRFDGPASVLMCKLDDLSRRTTVAFYHQILGGVVRPEHLVATELLVASRSKSRQHHGALRRYFQELVHPVRPVFLEGNLPTIADRAAAAELLLDLRTQFLASVSDAKCAAEKWQQSDQRLVAASQVKSLRDAGVKKIVPADFKLATVEEPAMQGLVREESSRKAEAVAALSHALTLGMQRLELALRLGDSGPPVLTASSSESDVGEYSLRENVAVPGSEQRLEVALKSLATASATLETLRLQYYALAALLNAYQPRGNNQLLVNAILAAARKTLAALSQFHDSLGRVPYPYDHLDPSTTMYSYVLKQLPAADAVGEVYHAAEGTLDSLYTLYLRILSDLAARAEKVEESLGMPPLPEPAEVQVT
jgi:hypothetical protein